MLVSALLSSVERPTRGLVLGACGWPAVTPRSARPVDAIVASNSSSKAAILRCDLGLLHNDRDIEARSHCCVCIGAVRAIGSAAVGVAERARVQQPSPAPASWLASCRLQRPHILCCGASSISSRNQNWSRVYTPAPTAGDKRGGDYPLRVTLRVAHLCSTPNCERQELRLVSEGPRSPKPFPSRLVNTKP